MSKTEGGQGQPRAEDTSSRPRRLLRRVLVWGLPGLILGALWWGVAWVSDTGRVERELAQREAYLRSVFEPLRRKGAKYEEVRAFLREQGWADTAWQSYPGEGGQYPPLVFDDTRQSMLITLTLGPQEINHIVTLRFGSGGRLRKIQIEERWISL